MRRFWHALLLFPAIPAALALDADEATRQAIQRGLLERDQQTDAFRQQLRQQQELQRAPAAERPAIESRQREERRLLDELNARQLRDVSPDAPAGHLRPRAAQERQPLISPWVTPPGP